MKSTYRWMIRLVIACSMMLCFSASTLQAAFDDATIDPQLNTTEKPEHIMLSWTDNPKVTQTITWHTCTAVSKGMVQYRKQSEASVKTVDAGAPEKFVTAVDRQDAPGEMHIFSTTLRKLDPATTYVYRVGDGTNWSEYSSFRTEDPKEEEFKFLIFADSQNDEANYSVWHDTLFKAYQANADAKFMINMGDMSDQGQCYRYFNNWFDASEGVINRIPEMPLIGNHETRDAVGSTTGQPTYYLKLFKVPGNGPEGYKGKAYSYDYGNAHFTVLDSQIYEESRTPEERKQMLESQIAWLEQDLASTNKTWKFLFYHKPQYYMKTTRSQTELKAFEPVIDKYHVDVVFTGHEHGTARTFPIKSKAYMSHPSEGTVYYVTGRCNLNTKSDLSPKVWDAYYFDPQDHPVYQTVEIKEKKAKIKIYEQDGRLIDKFVIDKEKPEDCTPVVPSGRLGDARLVLFGTPITYGLQPENINGIWYIDFDILVKFMGAKYDKTKGTLTFKKPAETVALSDAMFKDASRTMISLTALGQIGFECQHQEKTNFILVERFHNG